MYHDHKVLIGEHPFGHAGQLICGAAFLVVWIADSFFLKWATFLVQAVPPYVRIALGSMALLLAVYLTVESIRIMFFREGDRPVVVDFSVYQRVRHPMYLGAMLFYLGLFFFSLSLASLAVLLAVFGFYHFLARYEETLILRALGDDYRAYMKRVGMWLPGFSRRRQGQTGQHGVASGSEPTP